MKKSIFKPSGYAVYEQQHAIKNQFSEFRYFVDEEKFHEMARFSVTPGELIMSCSGTIGRVAQVPEGAPAGIINQALLKLSPQKELYSRFLSIWMQSPDFQEQLASNTEGVAIKNVASVKTLKTISIPLPPLEEQRRIVAVLDQAFAALDRARANAEANLADAEELFQSWLISITEDGRSNWPSKNLPDICENLDRARVPITKADRKAGDVPYYGASGEVDRVADVLFDEDLLLVSEDGANLLARTYPIAFSISGKSWVNNHAHVLRFDNFTDQEFVRLYLDAIPLDPFVSGMAQPKLNQKALNSIPIPFPDSDERAKIVSSARKMADAEEKCQKQYKDHLEDIEDLRQSILQKAFAGELI